MNLHRQLDRLTPPDAPTFLLLHGHPRTSATWHRVAAALRDLGHSVVCPDLRGYGRSSAPPTDAQHRPYSKRAMASDLVGLADYLGLGPLIVVGHDRGAYVALRLALDHPDRVERLAILDAVPLCEALDRTDARFATWWWHWFFFAHPDKPEQAILADLYGDPLAIWARWTHHLQGHDINSGHHMAEDGPHELVETLTDFTDQRAGGQVSKSADSDDRRNA